MLAPVFPAACWWRGILTATSWLLRRHPLRPDPSVDGPGDGAVSGNRTDKFFYSATPAGGQFVNRFLLAHPDKLIAASIGAPGRPTYLNFEEDSGISKPTLTKRLTLEALKKVPVQMLVGERDVAYIGDSPYGDNRTARLEALKENFEAHGVPVEL